MRVVLVDPSRTAAMFVSRMLEARDHEVRIFADGHEALDCIKADPDVGALITRAETLSISGLELCWEARLLATSQRPIYVILMSSTKDDDRLAMSLDHGADDILNMPPVPEELYARLRAAERLAKMQRELIRLATTDSLSGLFNRRAFFEKAGELCARAEAGEPLCAIMVDIDHFKRINDNHGHDAGDRAICAVAQELKAEAELVGRLGGEEFVLLLPGCSLTQAMSLAERLRRGIGAMRIKSGAAELSLTCSFGVSAWETGDTIDRLLRRADTALYEAKMSGRDRVMAGDGASQMLSDAAAGRVTRSTRIRA